MEKMLKILVEQKLKKRLLKLHSITFFKLISLNVT